ncbi:hypothetical protein NT6N_31430 [Oceaniferula spumae]|uniref:PEP-CTERM protein-sorting domain-containing protein n=1 Tax=Oceaniferula spumae TaxID=2979115 RepID=A0AAT9FQ48_9BACT
MKFLAYVSASAVLFTQGVLGATVTLTDLSSMTADHTQGTGNFASSTVNGSPIDSTQDITLQFEANFKTTNPSGEHTLFEFGGGNGTGLSLILSTFNNRIRLQAEQGGNQVGNADALLNSIPLNQTVTVTSSLDLDPTSSTLNLFINNVLVSSVTGDPMSDWSGTDGAGYFSRNGSILRPNFGNSTSGYGAPTASDAEVISDLRFYNDTFVATVPEPSSCVFLSLAGFGLVLRRKK